MAAVRVTARIAYVLPRATTFAPHGANSIDLCVRDLVRFSADRATTAVFCPKRDDAFEDIDVRALSPLALAGNIGKAFAAARGLANFAADIAIVENHLPTAAMIAGLTKIPVVFHAHSYEKHPRSRFKRAWRLSLYRQLAGIVFVSESCASRFRADYPDVSTPIAVVPNGLDMRVWTMPKAKTDTILVVGRAIVDKGHSAAMAAIARVFATRPNWRARFILAMPDKEPAYFAALSEMAAQSEGRIRIDVDLPYSEVQEAWRDAAIGMVMTISPEPFGRTALEALASGAALVTSGFGGLAEVCGSHALFANPRDPDEAAAALARLVDSAALRDELALAGRARVESLFDIRAVAARMDTALESFRRTGNRPAANARPAE